MKRKFLLLMLAVIMVLALLPVTALAYDYGGLTYNDNDFYKLQAFLNLPSAVAGQTNGQVLDAAYDPADPATWIGVIWNADAEERVIGIDWSSYGSLAGALNVSGCTALVYLYCDTNQLTSLDVSGCTAMQTLDCYSNQLASLDVSGCAVLVQLDCSENQLSSLNVSGCAALVQLDCDENQLTSLNVSGCTALQTLECYENELTSLDVSGCTALAALGCDNNQLTSLDVSGLTALVELDCYSNELTSLDVSGLTALEYLDCYSNQLTSLDVSGLTALEYLDCGANQLTSLNVSGLTALVQLDCYENQLTSLDVSGFTALQMLGCFENQLTSLNVSGCTALQFLLCGNNLLGSLDASDSPLMFIDTMNNLGSGEKNGNPLTQLHLTNSGGDEYALNAAGDGYVGVDLFVGGAFVATPLAPSTFINWTDAGGNEVSAAAEFSPGGPGDYTANFAPALTLSPDSGSIFTGGRITITPSYPGGTWDYPAGLLSAEASGSGMRFTGLAAGTARVTYTVGSQSAYVDIEITESELPSTGQDSTLIAALLALAACAGFTALALLIVKSKRKAFASK